MNLILLDAPSLLVTRLKRQGYAACTVGTGPQADYPALTAAQARDTLPAPRLWLTGSSTRPQVAGDDLVMLNRPEGDISQSLGLAWQANPFADELGLMLVVGGPAALVEQARPVLDTLAPKAGVWLHAGDVGAAHFLDQIMTILEGDVGQLAQLFQQLPSAGFAQFWQQHHARQQQLARLASDYLQHSANTPFDSAQGTLPWLALPLPGINPRETPARRLAALLAWLGGLGAWQPEDRP